MRVDLNRRYGKMPRSTQTGDMMDVNKTSCRCIQSFEEILLEIDQLLELAEIDREGAPIYTEAYSCLIDAV